MAESPGKRLKIAISGVRPALTTVRIAGIAAFSLRSRNGKSRRRCRRPEQCLFSEQFLAERSNPFGQPGKFPRRRVLVDNAAGNAPRDLRLDLLQSLRGVGLLARLDRRLDGLDEGPDAADS